MSTELRPPANVAFPSSNVSLHDAVRPDEGRIWRRIYTDPHIFEQEKEHIFARTWMFVGHESEIPEPGDVVTRPLGLDPTVVIRGDDGHVRVLLNTCRHRGMRVCRADHDNVAFLRCPYHGWTYSTSGDLMSVPAEAHYEPGTLQQDRLGLIEAAQVQNHRGLLFATWDRDAPPLETYLGNAAFYLDTLFARTPEGAEVVGAPQVWDVETAWKFAVDNFTDNQHVWWAHHSLVELGLLPPDPDFASHGHMLVLGGGHTAHFVPGPVAGFGLPEDLQALFPSVLTPDQVEIAQNTVYSAGTVFPNFHWLQLLVQAEINGPAVPVLNIRVHEPLTPTRTRMWSWLIVEKEASEAFRTATFETYVRTFGPSGIFDQDDMENWEECTRANRGPIAQRYALDHTMGLARPVATDWRGPGTAYVDSYGEMTQNAWYAQWLSCMTDGGAA